MKRAQEGVILFIALIVLVAMTLAGIALMRSVDTNVLIAGNLAFRQSTTSLADLGVEAARTWMTANGGSLTTNQPSGSTQYWANWQGVGGFLDFNGSTSATTDDYNWSQAATVTSPDPAFEIKYAIHRLCELDGDPTAGKTNCMKAQVSGGAGASAGGTKGAVTYGGQALPGTSTIYYRVTVRVIGPRNSTSFVQAVLN